MSNLMPFQVTMSHTRPVPGTLQRTEDVDGFEELYRQHAPRLYALAVRISGSPAEGEDLLQDIFVQAYRKLDGFRGEAAIGTWLYRLAVNYCVDYVRSRRGKMAKLTTALDVDHGREPMARRSTLVERLDLERAIRLLPEGCREVFVLHDVEGFNHQEIASMLGIAEGTSKSQVFRARQKLRAILK
jgi:RNA polymerase sigma-70 factor (ECF subfamily)